MQILHLRLRGAKAGQWDEEVALLRLRDDLIVGAHETQDLARNFFDEIGVWLCGREESDVALKLGAHGLEAFDLEL